MSATEGARIRDIASGAKIRLARKGAKEKQSDVVETGYITTTEERAQIGRDITEFLARYEREFKKQIEDRAIAGNNVCILSGFQSLAKLDMGVFELHKMGFSAGRVRHNNDELCIRVSWR